MHSWKISAHRHSQMVQLFLIASGRVSARVDGATYELSDGDFLYIPAQKVHEFDFLPGTEGHVISMPLSVVRSVGPISQELSITLASPLVGTAPDALWSMADLLKTIALGTSAYRAQKAIGLAHSVLALIAEVAPSPAANTSHADPRLAKLDGLIHVHLGDGWGAAEYARALSVSTGHLSRLCREATGHGASTYIEGRIMEEACRLLAFTQIPVSEVGYRLGYNDPSYFSKRFRAVRRQTPSDYRAEFVG